LSTKCVYRVDGEVHGAKDAITGKLVKWTSTKPCGRNIDVFLRAEYSELFPYRLREARYHDVFGFCQLHGPVMQASLLPWVRT
jgi:hypothetical protein